MHHLSVNLREECFPVSKNHLPSLHLLRLFELLSVLEDASHSHDISFLFQLVSRKPLFFLRRGAITYDLDKILVSATPPNVSNAAATTKSGVAATNAIVQPHSMANFEGFAGVVVRLFGLNRSPS